MIPEIKNIIIQNVNPEIDGGAFPIKRKKGDFVEVFAEVFREGHDVIAAQLLYRKEGTKNWEIKEMTCINPGLDQWKGVF
ncbi:MAG: maltotransferase domain-containing protein, partial [Verrucomicrobiota bacterium]|nr:maltotransferase domain-containing protein [Verrucomicrobiota bacterium]